MSERKAFNFLRSYAEALSNLGAKSQLKLYKAITEFALDGKEPADLSKTEKALWASFLGTLGPSREGWIHSNKARGPTGGGKSKEERSKEERSKENEAQGLFGIKPTNVKVEDL